MLGRLGNAWLFELQQWPSLGIGLLRPALGAWFDLRTRTFHRGTHTVSGKASSFIDEMFNLGIHELLARWVQLQPTRAVFFRLHWSGAGFARDILLCHLPYSLTRPVDMITRREYFS